MKTLSAILILHGLSLSLALAQTQEKELAQSPDELRARKTAESVAFQAEMVQRIFGIDMTIDGAIPKAVKADNPLQLLNPFAPSEYGSGWDNVILDPKDGRATGIRIFGVKF